MENKIEKIKERNIVPIIAMISAGKSKFLNLISNINYLECKPGIGTKFVNLIRYNPNINEPRFYHLKVIKNNNQYPFFKDLSYKEIVGKENIIQANKDLNEQMRKEKVNYEDLFYMTEINETPIIKDINYLLTHDLCDLPGLSEYQKEQINRNENKPEKNEININYDKDFVQNQNILKNIFKSINEDYLKDLSKKEKTKSKREKRENEEEFCSKINIENEKSYLTEIFKIIKDNIEGGIIMLNVENYMNVQNYEIIAKLHQVIKKEIIDYLVIFNKIDLSQNPTNDIKQCKGKIIEYFPKFQTFNLNLNTFIPMSMNILENELLMNKSFKHYITYHFYNFYSRMQKETNENNLNKTFKNHLLNILKAFRVKKKEIISKIKILKQKNIVEINKEISEIINSLSNLCQGKDLILDLVQEDFENNREITNIEDENEDDNDFYDIKSSDILYYFYLCYKEKSIMPPISKETSILLDYFKSNKKEKKKQMELIKENNIDLKTRANKNIIKHLKELGHNLGKLKINIPKNKDIIGIIRELIDYLNTYNVIFIPFLGPINSGKSTIINGIIGKDLLPTGLNECTKRGIIIGYDDVNDDDMVIFNINLEKKEYLNKDRYYFHKKKGSIIGKGLTQVRDTLIGLNSKYPLNEKDSFYYIKTKIKLYDELGIDEDMKKLVFLIDFPGFGTENFFEKDIYRKVMTICNSFLFIVKNLKINENSNAIVLNNLFYTIMNQTNSISSSKFIESCFFIVNNEKNQTTTENDLEIGKKQIKEIIKSQREKENIKLSFFNAQYYSLYNNYYNYFFDLNKLFKEEYKNFQDDNYNIFKYPENYLSGKKTKKFYNYLLERIKQKINYIFSKNPNQNWKSSTEIEKQIENIVNKNIYFNINNDEIKFLAKCISFSQENIDTLEISKKSGIINFKKVLLEQINFINEQNQKLLNLNIINIISRFDLFFKERKKGIQDFKDKINNIKSKLLEISENKWEIDIKGHLENLSNSLDAKNINELLREKTNEEIINDINFDLKKNLIELKEQIQIYIINKIENINKIAFEAEKYILNFYKDEYILIPPFQEYYIKYFGDMKKDDIIR